ncbi:hypothetical protein [Turneriella parva]|uniref:DUF4878 domain-containing protein n=1 Tax=Turneriella parva (strain ATCC BAA-1111 / DSM 21527 / NCTC 11395 / H) TaxID=869212 RepID=I4B3V5_TURPD|nr:hypothetical protein [Turneriella parva]AFM11962.1 hypothetical protein Turpa_1314 [Turneriella parva DSM 21527]
MKRITLITLSLLFVGSLFADALETARAEIDRQSKLIKKGDVKGLKARLTERQRARVTAAVLKKAKKELASYTLDDLVESVEEGEYQGQKTIKIKMKNGRTLTTLMEVNGQWFADTIWFR